MSTRTRRALRPGTAFGCTVVLLCFVAAGCLSEDTATGPPKLNLVIVLADALRAANLPLYGYPRDTAPNLTKLAEESIVFEHHLANYPGTPFSVSQMQSGRLMSPLLMGFTRIRVPVRKIADDLLILPRELQRAGYRTGIVTSHPWFNLQARILEYFDTTAAVAVKGGGPYSPFEALMPATERFLDATEPDHRPFLLYVHSMDPHAPYDFHPGHDQYRGAAGAVRDVNAYDSEIHYTDHWVRKLLDGLAERGLLEQTIFVFTSDHGEDHNEMGSEWWNKYHGRTLRRAQLHVPLIMRLPAGMGRPMRYTALSRHIDLAPTLLRLIDPEFPLERFQIDGEDLSAELLAGKAVNKPNKTSLAYTWRFWALHDRHTELHYDQWSDEYKLYKVETDPNNYPRLYPLDDADRWARMKPQLQEQYEIRYGEAVQAPADRAMLAKVEIALPTGVDRGHGAIPTFRASPADGLWFFQLPTLLKAEPAETPGSIVLEMPWSPGTYRVSVRLHEPLARRYRNRFRVHFLGAGNEPVQVDGDAKHRVPLGSQKIGRVMRVEISQPEGGVAIEGFGLALEEAEEPEIEIDADLEERLRQLGYVE